MFLFEPCEARRLLSADVIDAAPAPSGVSAKLSKTGVLTITGSSAKDTINIAEYNGKVIELRVDGGVNLLAQYGTTAGSGIIRISDTSEFRVSLAADSDSIYFDAALVKRIVVNTGAGRDYVNAQISKPNISVAIDGGRHNDTLVTSARNSTVLGGIGNDLIVSDRQPLFRTIRVTSVPGIQVGSSTTYRLDRSYTTLPATLDASGNRLDGGEGDDRFRVRGAEDTVIGGGGSDSVTKLNALDVFLSDLPELTTTQRTANTIKSRLAVFGVDVILEDSGTIQSVDVRTNSIT